MSMSSQGIAAVRTQLTGVETVVNQLGVVVLQAGTPSQGLTTIARVQSLLEELGRYLDDQERLLTPPVSDAGTVN